MVKDSYFGGRLNYRRLTLRREDGRVYLDRWGLRWNGVGAVYLHKMSAPDPGMDLHDHPWPFVSIILKGGYTEIVRSIRGLLTDRNDYPMWLTPDISPPRMREWGRWSWHTIGREDAHTIIALKSTPSWSLVITGRVNREWGFYEQTSGSNLNVQHRYVVAPEYDAEKRGVYVERQINDSNG